VKISTTHRYLRVIDEICDLNWHTLTRDELGAVSWAYYYFSVQFRENLELACDFRPLDEKLAQLREGECDTDNLSPFDGIAEPGERMNHDEFMRRLLAMSRLDQASRTRVQQLGQAYLASVNAMDPYIRAVSIASYEDGGLERVFRAILEAPDWDNPALSAFRHFLVEHIRFDSDANEGHGALSRHLTPDDRILPLWTEFRNILIGAAPALLA
jgi:hypothetical protein